MTETEKLTKSIQTIIEAWKRTNPTGKPEKEQVQRFNDLLEQLYKEGWDYTLGHENELPDEYLPARYLQRRANVQDDLQDELANIASRFRSCQEGSDAEQQAISDYHQVMAELFRIGHWPEVVEPDSELPHEHMPQIYKDAQRKRIEEYRASQKP
ncbi:hypothetical protein KRR26_18805 [Corallococcus sp. M34]|uniref:hypothetical protein n=1 Tax=Citreicoccus inhibens TaxID=2849499 RepID=UPI001C22CAD1|nr:hypothetical protein [Citreicoccus inhibens]MBU8897671.1 hypothetical protein [Citreicoccus inhibens]